MTDQAYASNHLLARLRGASLEHDDAVFAYIGDAARSFAKIFANAERIAAALTRCGLQAGDRVAAQIEKSMEALELYLGVVMAGGVFLPLNTAYTAREIGYFLADATPRILVCDPARARTLQAASQDVPTVLTLDAVGGGGLIDAARAEAPGFEAVARGPKDLAALLYTSGTTGRAKGAMLSHRALASNAQKLRECWRFGPDDTLIHALPVYHTHGLFVATNVALLAGSAIILIKHFDIDEIMAALPRATSMMGVPTFYTRLLKHPGLTRRATAGMRLFISGSAPLLAETHAKWQAKTGHAILERYGMTETNMNTSNPYEGDRRAGTVGLPLPNVELRITEPKSGRALPPGDVGMIEVKGPNLFSGYWNMPDKTAQAFRQDGFFITGDIGVVDARGYVSIVGRDKDLIITGGLNVYPKEIENLINDLEGVDESAVIGAPHPDFGEAVVALVVALPGTTVCKASIARAIAYDLARFKQPKEIFLIDELPRNAMGKVQKNLLRQQYKRLFA